jgi:heme/copper-type cytochrome/quinol oxidase subunit 3
MSTIEPARVLPEEAMQEDAIDANIAVGARLGVAATIFVFFCPCFAYFYLRSLNTAGLWQPAGAHPPQVLGAAITVLFAASAGMLLLAARAAMRRPWRALAACSLALGISGVVLQCVEYATLGFGPMSGGYASVFIGWTALDALVVLGTMAWLETLVAYGWRNRSAPADVVRSRIAALAFYWACLAGFAVVMWAVLYLV